MTRRYPDTRNPQVEVVGWMMDYYQALTQVIGGAVFKYGYGRCRYYTLHDRIHVSCIMVAKECVSGPLFVVIDLPDTIESYPHFASLLKRVRRLLSKRYARFPFIGRLGMYCAFLCSHDQYESLHAHTNNLRDRTCLHATTLLGACLVDRDALQMDLSPIRPAFHAGKHIQEAQEAIHHWLSSIKLPFRCCT